MYVRKRGRSLRGRLGLVSTPVAGSLVIGSSPISGTFRRIGPSRPVFPVNGGPVYPVSGGSPFRSAPYLPISGPYQFGVNNPSQPVYGVQGGGWMNPATQSSGVTNLAQLQQLYQNNPSSLTPAQVQMLQAAGTIAGTVPPSSASLLTGSSGAIDPTTGQPYATELAAAQAAGTTTTSTDPLMTDYYGLPLIAWLGIGGVGLFLLMGKRGR